MKTKTGIILKTIITLLLLSPVVYFAFEIYYPESKTIPKTELEKIYEKYSIVSEKDASFSNKVERGFIISRVETPLLASSAD